MVLRITDLETTGTDPKIDRICEIASVDLVRTSVDPIEFGISNPRETLINPGIPIPPQSSAVHHILDEDVVGAPPIEDVIDDFLGADAYIAHNAAFEETFLTPLIGEQTWICTFKCALRVWPDAPGHSNQALRYWLGYKEPFGRARSSIDPHRALSDVIVTACILAELIKSASWRDLVTWSKEPPLKTVCTFGTKHKGKRYDEIAVEDPSYLEWIIEKSEMDADTKWNAKYWLERRGAAAA